ncbi:MAG: DNA-binding response regulator KdpE, partial [Actinomycetia bacterium]|nr:DNA-binding response regulator KdpE [Actinomycetes bacterium]
LVREHRPDLVLLDLMLPGVDGFDLCRDLRAESSVGIIVVSARRGEQDKVRALNLGADDYLTKPFGIDELLARITALLRRSRVAATPQAPQPALAFGDIAIDLDAQLVTKKGELVHLTPTEFALLRELALVPGKLLSHAVLLRNVWGPGYETETEYTRVYVRRLRAKLEEVDGPPLIVTEPRAGYRMVTPDD